MYQPDETIRLEVRMGEDTVWLTQQQMADLFNATKQNVSLHINNIYDEGELERGATVKDYLTVQKEGKRMVNRKHSMPTHRSSTSSNRRSIPSSLSITISMSIP